MAKTRSTRGSRVSDKVKSIVSRLAAVKTKAAARELRTATSAKPSAIEPTSDTEQHLFDCALTLFAEKGYSATSVREIITSAGVTQPTLYYYCRDKADLFQRLIERHFRASHQHLTDVLNQTPGCEARLRTLVRSSFEYCVADPRIPRLMFQTYFGPPIAETARILDKLTATRFDLVTRLMREGIESGELNSADPRFLALSFCCLMDQPINLFSRNARPGRYLTNELAEALVTQFLHGSLKSSAPPFRVG